MKKKPNPVDEERLRQNRLVMWAVAFLIICVGLGQALAIAIGQLQK